MRYFGGLRKRKQLGKKIEHEKLAILANKKAGGYKNGYRRRLLEKFAKKRNAPIFFFPMNRKDMLIGSEEKVKDYDQVVIAGGDGSFDSALNHTPLNHKTLGFFPLGAGNALYAYFYRGKRFEYLRSRLVLEKQSLMW